MPLQIRLRHPLGEKMLDLEERSADRPIVVGRAADAEVQVPSTQVSPRHCLLYQDGGQWVVADAGEQGGQGGQGVLVNGQPVSGPVYVNSGDVVTLGKGLLAPRIEIDPMGSGKVSSISPAAAAASAAAPAAPGYSAYAPADSSPQQPAQDGGWDFTPTQSGGRYYVPKPQKSNSMVGIGIAICAAIAIIGAILIWFISERQKAAQRAAATPPHPAAPAGGAGAGYAPDGRQENHL